MAEPGNLADVRAELVGLCEQVEGLRDRIDVLVWWPLVNPGGGVRLLLSLLPEVARDRRVRFVRVAVPRETLGRDPAALAVLLEAGIGVYELGRESKGPDHRAELVTDHGQVYRVVGTDAWRASTLARLARDVDVVYAPWPHSDAIPPTDRPLVCTVQDTTLLDHPESSETPASEREWMRGWLEGAARVVVSSQATRAALARRFGPELGEVRVVHHAIRPGFLAAAEPLPPALRARLPDRYVVCATNTALQKNLDVLLHVWSRFEGREEWPLVLIGHNTESLVEPFDDRTPWRSLQLHGLMDRLGLRPDRELFALGYVDDAHVGQIIGGAAALAMPSTNEGGGSFPVEEALALGVPVLCSDIPVMREHLAGRTAPIGWFDPFSVDSVLAAVRELVAEHDRRVAATRAAMADPRPTWSDVAREYVDVFREAAGRAATPALASRGWTGGSSARRS